MAIAVKVNVEKHKLEPCNKGTNLQRAPPNNQTKIKNVDQIVLNVLPLLNAEIGVIVPKIREKNTNCRSFKSLPETSETTMSEKDKLTMKIFRTDCKDLWRKTAAMTSELPATPNLKHSKFTYCSLISRMHFFSLRSNLCLLHGYFWFVLKFFVFDTCTKNGPFCNWRFYFCVIHLRPNAEILFPKRGA